MPKISFIHIATVNLELAAKALKNEIDQTPRGKFTDETIRQLREVSGDINACVLKLQKVPTAYEP